MSQAECLSARRKDREQGNGHCDGRGTATELGEKVRSGCVENAQCRVHSGEMAKQSWDITCGRTQCATDRGTRLGHRRILQSYLAVQVRSFSRVRSNIHVVARAVFGSWTCLSSLKGP